MSNKTSITIDEDRKCCAKCGTRRSASVKLSKCSRCLTVKYCSRECQTLDWKRHKKAECANKSLPTGAARQAISFSPEVVASSLFRAVLVQEPKNAFSCCWCCARLLKKCGEGGSNPNQHVSGSFWGETFGRSVGSVPKRGTTFPAIAVLERPGGTGYSVSIDDSGLAAACFDCSLVLYKGDQKQATKHIQRCEDYLYDQKFRAVSITMPTLNYAEKRLLAKISLEQNPNLSDRELSVAGYMDKEGSEKKIHIPYNYRKFEHLAFSFLMNEASEFEGSTNAELIHYTRMRLYSVDKAWRNDYDYVVFSILRCAAYGVEGFRDIVRQLPTPTALNQAPNLSKDQMRMVSLLPDFQ